MITCKYRSTVCNIIFHWFSEFHIMSLGALQSTKTFLHVFYSLDVLICQSPTLSRTLRLGSRKCQPDHFPQITQKLYLSQNWAEGNPQIGTEELITILKYCSLSLPPYYPKGILCFCLKKEISGWLKTGSSFPDKYYCWRAVPQLHVASCLHFG